MNLVDVLFAQNLSERQRAPDALDETKEAADWSEHVALRLMTIPGRDRPVVRSWCGFAGATSVIGVTLRQARLGAAKAMGSIMPAEVCAEVDAPAPLVFQTIDHPDTHPKEIETAIPAPWDDAGAVQRATVARALVQAALSMRKDGEAMADVKYNLEERIALTRRNISELTERAAVANGAAAEERLANLLSDQQDLLNCLLEQRATRPEPDANQTKSP
ncbi:hypothetical protein [Bosea sp. Root381]|uniref:hypothetical protein n=1 Tax=Bosea sp. Root381 TaxID=1736524 RepID=UPI001FCD4D30|nr:hypothetical protein [Bosea sp. Root381]